MTEYDFTKGKFNPAGDENLNKYISFNKKSLFTFGNGDNKVKYKEVDNTHIGQLKLLISELQTLTYYTDTTLVKTVVYVGAAPGNHIFVLSKLFPMIKFYLYDISDNWDKRLIDNDSIIINNKYFEDSDVDFWRMYHEPYLFISDIRNLNVQDKPRDLFKREAMVWSDMVLQKNWLEALRPEIALLKFKLPYPTIREKNKYYLDGTILRQFYARQASAETRLLVRGISYRDWNLTNYEEINAYHNQFTRKQSLFLHPLKGTQEEVYKERDLTNDFESVGFYIIVMDYLKKINTIVNETNIKKILDFILDNCYSNKKIDLRSERRL
jgi:hypothetical protein